MPWVSSESDDAQDFLEISSIDKNAFVEFTNLTCLRLIIQLKLECDTLDFKHLQIKPNKNNFYFLNYRNK
jgi:hypothetical protein